MYVAKLLIRHICNSAQYILVEKKPSPESNEKKNNNNKQINK